MNFVKTVLLSVIVSATTFYALIDPFKQSTIGELEAIQDKLKSAEAAIEYDRSNGTRDLYSELYERTSIGECKRSEITADLIAGTVGGLSPSALAETVKKKFPCFTFEGELKEEQSNGGGVFYLDHGFLFYTKAKAIAINRSFRGSLSPRFALSRGNIGLVHGKYKKEIEDELEQSVNAGLFKLLPEYHNAVTSGATTISVYEAPYGCLIIQSDDSSILDIVITNNACELEAKAKRFIRG